MESGVWKFYVGPSLRSEDVPPVEVELTPQHIYNLNRFDRDEWMNVIELVEDLQHRAD